MKRFRKHVDRAVELAERYTAEAPAAPMERVSAAIAHLLAGAELMRQLGVPQEEVARLVRSGPPAELLEEQPAPQRAPAPDAELDAELEAEWAEVDRLIKRRGLMRRGDG